MPSAPSRAARAQRGFTLTELLTAVGVVGLGLSLAVPSFNAAARSNLRAAAINDLVATLHVARSEALARNATVALCPSADGATCSRLPWETGWIRFLDGNRNFRADPGEPLLGAAPAPAGVEIHTAAFAGALAFGPAGRVAVPDGGAGAGDFLFCGTAGDPSPRVVVLTALGQPVLADRRLDGQAPDCAG